MKDYFQFDNEDNYYLQKIKEKRDELLSEFACKDESAIRKSRKTYRDNIRSEYGVDIDKILHNTLYNRYTDKTQVFSFYKNDDITRRALHVQLVARIARIIGDALSLNLDLIEAIALGHDIGHTPFGHKGENYLSECYYAHTKRYFNHNVHSVRVLMYETNSDLTLQTYDGILCHCGEKAFEEYRPRKITNFQEFDHTLKQCYEDKNYIKTLVPATLEGCVVRISDMIAYVGKDRQDASKANLLKMNDYKCGPLLGKRNATIIDKLIKNIIKNSRGKDYLKMDNEVYEELKAIQKENNDLIYQSKIITRPYEEIIKPMMRNMYETLLLDIENNNFNSKIYQHHLNHKILGNCYREQESRKIKADPNDIVMDYIASMTDDYFIDLYKEMFSEDELNNQINYISYFQDDEV